MGYLLSPTFALKEFEGTEADIVANAVSQDGVNANI